MTVNFNITTAVNEDRQESIVALGAKEKNCLDIFSGVIINITLITTTVLHLGFCPKGSKTAIYVR